MTRTQTIRRLCRVFLLTLAASVAVLAGRPADAQTGAAPTTTGLFAGPYALLSPANPPGGSAWYTGWVRMTLTATAGTGGGGLTTLYTLNGSGPLTYSAPVNITGNGTHTITFYSLDAAGDTESVNTQTLTIDTAPPVTTASVSDAVLTLSATDAVSGVATTFYTLDGGPARTYSGPVLLASGATHQVRFWSVDRAGNTEAAHTLTEDLSTPTTAASVSGRAGQGGWYVGAVQVTLTASDSDGAGDIAATFYTLDAGATQTYPGPITVSADGTHPLTFWSVDRAGNVETAHTLPLKIDATPPVTTASVSGAVVTLSATDAVSGVAATDYTLDGGATLTYTAPITVTGAGSHTVTFWSVDAAGNTEARHTLTVTTAASAAALVTLKTSLSAAIYGQAVTLTASVTPAKSGGGTPTGTVTISEGGTVLGTATLSGGSAALPLPLLGVGTHSLMASYGGDSAFLPAASAALSQKISQSAATATATASAPSVVRGHNVTFTFTVAPTAPGGGVPTGTVVLQDLYRATLGPVTLTAGRATFSTTGLAAGSHTLTAIYSGDADFVKSTAPPLTETVTAVRIMPMGDGLTSGYCLKDPAAQANGGYRGPLYAQTVGQGWAAQYVGSVVINPTLGSCEGHAGWTIEMAQAREPAYVTQYRPDVILLMSGVDDLEKSVPASQMLSDMGTLLDALSAAKPGVQIVVASLTPLDAPGIDPTQEAAYNAGLPAVVQQAAGRGDVVSFVDMHTLCGWVPTDYQPPTADGVHPNSPGYAKMATVWYNVLAALPLQR